MIIILNKEENYKFYFYHLLPKSIILNDKGLITPEYCYKKKDFELYKKMTNKYRNRLCYGWAIYPAKKPDELTEEEIYEGLNKFRKSKDGNNKIYMFRYPPYKKLGKNMKKVLKEKKIIRINLDDKVTKNYIKDIDWGHLRSNTDNPKLNEKYYRKVTKEEYFREYDDEDSMIFANLNHIGITTIKGYLPLKVLKEVVIE